MQIAKSWKNLLDTLKYYYQLLLYYREIDDGDENTIIIDLLMVRTCMEFLMLV